MVKPSELIEAVDITDDDRLLGNDGASTKMFPVDLVRDHARGYSGDTMALSPYNRFDRYYIHVDEFGAVPDSRVDGSGTDSTAAFQAAIDSVADNHENAGKIILVGPGRYKLTGQLNVRSNAVTIMSPMMLHNGSLGNDVVTYPATVINWYGPNDTGAVIDVRHPTNGQISKFACMGIQFNDRRTVANVTGGNCIEIHRTVNDIFLKHLLFHGFKGGDQIHIDGGFVGGGRSDCVSIEKIWCLGNPNPPRYGIYCGGIDNVCLIKDIRGDTTTSGLLALIKVEVVTGACHIEGVKHENTGGTDGCTVEIGQGPSANPVTVTGVAVRIGTGSVAGPNVRFTTQWATNTVLMQLWRQNSAVLVENIIGNGNISGIHLPFWAGSRFGTIECRQDGDVYMSGNTWLATGQGSVTGRTLRFFDQSAGATKRTVTGNVTTGTLADLQGVVDLLLSSLAAYGLVTDSTT